MLLIISAGLMTGKGEVELGTTVRWYCNLVNLMSTSGKKKFQNLNFDFYEKFLEKVYIKKEILLNTWQEISSWRVRCWGWSSTRATDEKSKQIWWNIDFTKKIKYCFVYLLLLLLLCSREVNLETVLFGTCGAEAILLWFLDCGEERTNIIVSIWREKKTSKRGIWKKNYMYLWRTS